MVMVWKMVRWIFVLFVRGVVRCVCSVVFLLCSRFVIIVVVVVRLFLIFVRFVMVMVVLRKIRCCW